MNPLSKEYLIKFYDTNLMLFGDRPETLRWSAQGQLARYNLLLNVNDSLEGASILDYGCGKGDFYGFLADKDIKVNYTGMDINPSLIALARTKHPLCKFEVHDVEESPVKEEFDYIFICGVFNNRVDGAEDSMRYAVSNLFKQARKGLVFTALSSLELSKSIDLHYTDPALLLDFIRSNITGNVTMIEGAIPFDLTFYLRKNIANEL